MAYDPLDSLDKQLRRASAYFSGSARVDLPSAMIDNAAAGTRWAWLYFRAAPSATQALIDKCVTNSTNEESLALSSSTTLRIFRTRATTSLQGTAALTNFAAYAVGKWLFVAGVYDTAGANSAQRVLMGDQTVPAAEPSSYSTQTAGAGAATDTTGGACKIGNNLANATPALAQIAIAGVHSVALTIPELLAIQKNPTIIGRACVGLYFPGARGTGVAPDWSGQANHGIGTGVTLGEPMPRMGLRPRRPPAWLTDTSPTTDPIVLSRFTYIPEIN